MTKVPLVCQSSLFDLMVGAVDARPDGAMGCEVCVNAQKDNYRDGCHGAGTGATVGKFFGRDFCMKSGVGSCAVQIGDLKVGAIAAVNACGDVFDWKTGRQVAGLLTEDRHALRSTTEAMYASERIVDNKFTGNTTLGVILTNAIFDKARLNKIEGMMHNGYARSIRPVHTSADGDSIYTMSVGDAAADMVMVKTLAAVVSYADGQYTIEKDGETRGSVVPEERKFGVWLYFSRPERHGRVVCAGRRNMVKSVVWRLDRGWGLWYNYTKPFRIRGGGRREKQSH